MAQRAPAVVDSGYNGDDGDNGVEGTVISRGAQGANDHTQAYGDRAFLQVFLGVKKPKNAFGTGHEVYEKYVIDLLSFPG